MFEFVPLDPFVTLSCIALSRLELQQYGVFATLSYTSWWLLKQEVWLPPSHEILKFNTYAIWKDQFSPADVGVVVRDLSDILLDRVIKRV